MKTVKYIFQIILTLIITSGMLFMFFVFTLPAIKQDREAMVKQEMDAHNQTLEEIKKDFSYVLSAENVSVQMNKTIQLTISGEDCNLNVELNRELTVLSLETVDKTEKRDVGLAFACLGECVALIFAVVWFCCIIGNISNDIRIARKQKRELKTAKQRQTDIEVVI